MYVTEVSIVNEAKSLKLICRWKRHLKNEKGGGVSGRGGRERKKGGEKQIKEERHSTVD